MTPHRDSESAGRVTPVVAKNISALLHLRKQEEAAKSAREHVADSITAFSGSMLFVLLHVIWFSGWVLWNGDWVGIPPFDPYPFGMLTTIVSLEAIFLSTFVLITQNRQAQAADRRADLDLQINLLAEHEITRLLRLTHAIAKHVGVDMDDAEMHELERDVKADAILNTIDSVENGLNGRRSPAKG